MLLLFARKPEKSSQASSINASVYFEERQEPSEEVQRIRRPQCHGTETSRRTERLFIQQSRRFPEKWC